MNVEKPLWFCWVTKDNAATAQRVQDALERQIQRFHTPGVHLLILDKSIQAPARLNINRDLFDQVHYYSAAAVAVLEERYRAVYQRVGYLSENDSVQRARLQLYCAFLFHQKALKNAIVWQLDDDMCLGETRLIGKGQVAFTQERDYCALVRAYHRRYPWVDAAIGYCSYAPPLPIFLYLQQQLSDFDRRPERRGHLDWNYHDLYAETSTLERRASSSTVVQQVLQGIPLQPLLTPSEAPLRRPPRPHLLRGGNFLVFNPTTLLALPHTGFHYGGWIGRRSDMMHAFALRQKGHRICDIDLSLIHYRAFEGIRTDKLQKNYIEDVLGAVAFRYLVEGSDAAQVRWQRHLAHLSALQVYAQRLDDALPVVQLRTHLQATYDALQKKDWVDLEAALHAFKHQFLTTYLNTASCTK